MEHHQYLHHHHHHQYQYQPNEDIVQSGLMMSPTANTTTTTSTMRSSSSGNTQHHYNVNPHANLVSPPPMLPDDHWNDIEMLSFGLSETRLADPDFTSSMATTSVNQHHPSEQQHSIIHYAATNGYMELMKKLILVDRVEVDALDSEHNTALIIASSVGHTEMAKFLLENGANVNVQNVFDNSPLHEASWRGYSQTLETLCRYRTKMHLKNKQGHTALHLAAQKGHNQCCRVLLLSGCKPNIKNNFGDTPLHSASRYGHVGVVRILISAFANVNELNKNDDTALHIASAMCRKKLVKILLESGCNPTIVNKQGETPMNIALRKDFLDIQELIAAPPPLKPIYLKQQELYDRPLQGSYKDIYCSVPKSTESLYPPPNHRDYGDEGEDGEGLYSDGRIHLKGHLHDQQYHPHQHHHHHHHHKSRNRRSRGCKSDYSNGYLTSTSAAAGQRSIEKQSSSVSKYYNSMLRRFGGASPLDQDELIGNEHEVDERSRSESPSKVHQQQQQQQQIRRNREFPKPKLNTLPSEPLEKGEQYFVDLSGHIHKGRIPPGPDMEPLINHTAVHHIGAHQH